MVADHNGRRPSVEESPRQQSPGRTAWVRPYLVARVRQKTLRFIDDARGAVDPRSAGGLTIPSA
jgi:hypothetical protein